MKIPEIHKRKKERKKITEEAERFPALRTGRLKTSHRLGINETGRVFGYVTRHDILNESCKF